MRVAISHDFQWQCHGCCVWFAACDTQPLPCPDEDDAFLCGVCTMTFDQTPFATVIFRTNEALERARAMGGPHAVGLQRKLHQILTQLNAMEDRHER